MRDKNIIVSYPQDRSSDTSTFIAKNGQPTKDANCDNGNTNAMERKLYKNKILDTKERYEKIKSKYDYGSNDSSFRTSLIKTTAIGKSGFNSEDQALSFKSVHVQDINRAKNRVRKTGCAVPRKVQAKVLPPPSTSVETYKSETKPTTASEKVSVFMPRHLRSRIGCKDFCPGGEVITTNNNNTIDCINSNVMAADMMSNIPCLLSVNNIYVLDNVNDGKKYVVLNSPYVNNYSKHYGVGKGQYLFSNVRLEDAFTILNHNKKDLVFIKGDNLNKFTRLVDGINYDFYYGDVDINVTGDFGVVSIYFYKYGYLGGKYLFNYIETCSDLNGTQCLSDPTSIRLVRLENGQHRIAFNDITELYQSQYGLKKGTYLVKNVPIDLAFTLDNKDFATKIFLTSSEPSFQYLKHLFYYGDVVINVLDDFGYASLIMYYDHFIGGKYIFKYSDMCPTDNDLQGEDDMVETSETNLPDTLYSQNLNKVYAPGTTYYEDSDGKLAVKKRSDIDISMFIKYVVSPLGPQLPDWLSFDPLTGEMSGTFTTNNLGFYVNEFKIRAMLNNNTYKEYNVYIAAFNNVITESGEGGGGGAGGGGGDGGMDGGDGGMGGGDGGMGGEPGY